MAHMARYDGHIEPEIALQVLGWKVSFVGKIPKTLGGRMRPPDVSRMLMA